MNSLHSIGIGGGIMWLFWLFLIAVVFYFIKSAFVKEDNIIHRHPSAIDTLNERYAKGEIELNEYQKIKKNLQVEI